jgi:hypothetical protein
MRHLPSLGITKTKGSFARRGITVSLARHRVVPAVVLSLAILTSAVASSPSFAASGGRRVSFFLRGGTGSQPPSHILITPAGMQPQSGVVAYPNGRDIAARSLDKHSIPLWQGEDDGFRFKMVGTDPTIPEGAHALTVIKAEVFPVVVTLDDTGAVFDPTVVDDSCSPDGSAVSLTMASPIFQPTTIAPGGTNLGSGEYPSELFQRANFYADTSGPGAINSDYGVDLRAAEEPPIDVTVPLVYGETLDLGCDHLGLVRGSAFDEGLQSVIESSLGNVIKPDILPIFVLSNVVLFGSSASDCCILGYHAAIRNPAHNGAFQTYVVADFDTSGLFAGSSDVTDLSHEVAEWMDDPTGDNQTPPWGNVGQVTEGCQANLEVGDPLAGTNFAVTMPNGYTYHPQDLAFKSWFFGDQPSTGVNGWYSFNGTFKTPAPVCVPSSGGL